MNIKKISIAELIKDKDESIADIKVCEQALSLGVARYSGGFVRGCLNINKNIIVKIDAELLRRSLKYGKV